MKRVFLVAAAILSVLASPSIAVAQSYGVRFGVNLSPQAITPEGALGNESSKPGIVAGGFLTFWNAKRWPVEIGGQFSVRRNKFDTITNTVRYLEAPVVVRFPVFTTGTTRVSALAGGSVGFVMAARDSVVGGTKDAYKTEFAPVLGAQIAWGSRWLADIRYLYGVTEVYTEQLENQKARWRSLQILVGFRVR